MKKLIDIATWVIGIYIMIFMMFSFLVFWVFFATMPFHDLYLSHMGRALQSIEHPHGSKKLKQYVFFGSRYTDITECTYEAGEIRSTSLTPEDVLHAYNNESSILAGPVRVIIISQDTLLPLDNPAENWIVEFREKILQYDAHTYYLVYLYKPGMSGLGDIRCFD